MLSNLYTQHWICACFTVATLTTKRNADEDQRKTNFYAEKCFSNKHNIIFLCVAFQNKDILNDNEVEKNK